MKVDTVSGNKKIFNENPHLKEFAKPGIHPGFASEYKRQVQANIAREK